MANNPSLAEYLAQAQRGVVASRGLGPAVLGPDYFTKQTSGSYFGSGGDGGTAENVFTTTFGRKVWHALNNQTRLFNALPRVVWGNVAGWRVRTDRGANRSRPVTETGALPSIDVSDIQTVSSLPRIVGTTFGASVRSMFTAQLEGGVGDVLGMEMENAQIDHIKEINQEMMSGSAFLTSGGSTTTAVMPSVAAAYFHIGDTVGMHDESAGAYDRAGGSAVSAISGGTVTMATGTTFADGDVAFIHSRAGFTSIDDIVAADFAAAANTGPGGSAARVRAYDLAIGGRTAGTWNAGARVDGNAGVGRDLTLNLLDNCIRDIRVNGGEPKLIVMGHDQYFRLERLLQTQQRYMGVEEYQVGVGNERTFPGTRTGLVLATYQGIPILPEPDAPKSVSTGDAVLGSNVFILDTDYIEVAIAQPTQYIENRDYLALDALVVRGLFYTLGEMRCRNIWVQAKITDLNE